MRVLLDTHAFLWYSAGDSQLSDHALSIIEDANNDRFLSAASLLEMAIKSSLGRLTLSDSFEQFANDGMARVSCTLLSLTIAQAGRLSALPFHHRDPFDRMLVAQALVDDMDVLSVDKIFDAYGIRRHW